MAHSDGGADDGALARVPVRICAVLEAADQSRGGAAAQGTPTTLREAAATAAGISSGRAALHVGTCVMPDLLDDPIYAATIEREFTHVVVEHHQKWEPLTSPTAAGSAWGGPYRCMGKTYTALSGCYDFGPADKIVDWALERGLKVKGHTLCWHVTSPAWLDELDGAQCAEALRRHIFTTCGHFRGRVESWDVVNEALAPDGSLADNVFLRKMGPGYIAQAFRWAKQADPEALLLYNDNKVEGAHYCSSANTDSNGRQHATAAARRAPKRTKRSDHSSNHQAQRPYGPSPDFYRKSDAMYELLKSLLAEGVHIDGVGLQAHFNAAGTGVGRCPSPAAIAANVSRLAALGSKEHPFLVNISEMDVRISKLPAGCSERLRTAAQCQIYHDVLTAAAASSPSFVGITLWGFTDKHTWVTQFYHADSPLIFDEEYRRKPAYFAMRQALLSLRGQPEGPKPAVAAALALVCSEDTWGESWMQPEPTLKSLAAMVDGHNGGRVVAPSSAGSALPDWQQPASTA